MAFTIGIIMIKYAKIVDNDKKMVDVGLGTNEEFYKSIGMTQMEVEEAYDGQWYLQGYAPAKPEPTLEEKLAKLEEQYNMPRVIREGILGNPTMYSEFNVNRAKELEDIAEKIRQAKGGK